MESCGMTLTDKEIHDMAGDFACVRQRRTRLFLHLLPAAVLSEAVLVAATDKQVPGSPH